MKQKAEIEGGATIWARQTIDSEIFEKKPDKWFKIWFYLVNRVNHKYNKRFKRGECFLKYDWIADKTGASKNEIDKCIRFLKQSTMIATQKSTRGMVVNVLKYDFYQTLDNYYGDILVDTPVETKSKQSRHYKQECNKNVKNEDNKLPETSSEEDFNFKDKLDKMKSDKCKHIRIIELYWRFKGWQFYNKQQYESAIKRDLRAAANLKGYELTRIEEVMYWLLDNTEIKFTLETVHKYIDENLNNLNYKK